MHAIGIELTNQPARDDLALVLVAVVAVRHQRGGALAVADACDRDGDDPVGVAVVRVSDLEPTHAASGGIEIDAAVDAEFLRAHAFATTFVAGSPPGHSVARHRVPILEGYGASGEGGIGEGPGLGDPRADGPIERFVEAARELVGAHPHFDLAVMAAPTGRHDVDATEAAALVGRHHGVGEGGATRELALMPAEIDEVVLDGEPPGHEPPLSRLKVVRKCSTLDITAS